MFYTSMACDLDGFQTTKYILLQKTLKKNREGKSDITATELKLYSPCMKFDGN